MEIKNLNTEILWPAHLMGKQKVSMDEGNATFTADPAQVNSINEDKITLSGYAGISFKNMDGVIRRLKIYRAITQTNQLLINWGKIIT